MHQGGKGFVYREVGLVFEGGRGLPETLTSLSARVVLRTGRTTSCPDRTPCRPGLGRVAPDDGRVTPFLSFLASQDP